MKKLLLLTLLCTVATSFSTPSEELVHAIHDSDYQKVQQLTKGTTLTAIEQFALIDLAQDIAFIRNNEFERRKLEEKFGTSRDNGGMEYAFIVLIFLVGGGISLQLTSLALADIANNHSINKAAVGVLATAVGLFTGSLLLIKGLDKSATEHEKAYDEKGKKIKQALDDALNIKQLLILLPVEN
jgi:hypothetical protein